MSYVRKLSILIVLTLYGIAHGTACLSQSISPSAKTRTYAAPKKDYFQQVTKGHPNRWFNRDMALRVLIEPAPQDLLTYKPIYATILRQSFQEWETASVGKIKFQFVTEGPADIICKFVANFPENEVLGRTHCQLSPHHMDFASISIGTTSKITDITEKIMHAICLHEIGHALGVINHSLDPHDVMYYAVNTPEKALSERDINTMNILYEFKTPELNTKPNVSRFTPSYPPRFHGQIALSGVEYDTYTRVIAAKLLKHNQAIKASPMLECRVSFLADADGNIFNYRIFESSGNETFDQKVLDSLFAALPLPPAPAKLLQNERKKVPIAFNFRSDGWVVPYIQPDKQSDWLKAIDEPPPQDYLRDLERDKTASPKTLDRNLEPWIVAVTQKAQAAWKPKSSGKAEVLVGIRKNGSITHLLIVTSNNNEVFNKSVLDACIAAEPYPAPPDAEADTVEVNMLFQH